MSEPKKAADGADMRVISCVPMGDNVYEVTTESAKYGRVTQTVLVCPWGFTEDLEEHLSNRPAHGSAA